MFTHTLIHTSTYSHMYIHTIIYIAPTHTHRCIHVVTTPFSWTHSCILTYSHSDIHPHYSYTHAHVYSHSCTHAHVHLFLQRNWVYTVVQDQEANPQFNGLSEGWCSVGFVTLKPLEIIGDLLVRTLALRILVSILTLIAFNLYKSSS